MNFVVATITPISLENIGYKTYIIFMSFMIFGIFWAAFLLPELKGKSLEEVGFGFGFARGPTETETDDILICWV